MFKKIGNFIKGLFDKAIAACKKFLDSAIPAASQIVIGELNDFATAAVKELTFANISSEEKRQEAFNRIKSYAKDNAIEAKDSLINLVIELALQAVKNGAV